jgi:hypothetical protein
MNRKIIYSIVVAVLLVSAIAIYWSSTAPNGEEIKQTVFAGGEGTEESPYQVATAEQLNQVRYNLDKHFILTDDIDLSVYESWEPIGTYSPLEDESPDPEAAFTGYFDGNGKTICNLSIEQPEGMAVGLFGCVAGEAGSAYSIRDLTVENVDVTGYYLVSGLVGYHYSGGTIENVILTGTNTIRGYQAVGGIAGGSRCGLINCGATADIMVLNDGGGSAGVLVGGLEDCSVADCKATGTVTAEGNKCWGLGGLAGGFGGMLDELVILNCNASVSITAMGENNFLIGGLLGSAGIYGEATPTQVVDCSTDTTLVVSSTTIQVGGLVGGSFFHESFAEEVPEPASYKITYCTTAGSITGGERGGSIGSIAGYAFKSTVKNCSTTITWNLGALKQIGLDESNVSTVFADGSGTTEDPYQIATAAQLDEVRYYLNSSFILTADIDLLNYENWQPIGTFESLSTAPEDAEVPKPAIAFTGNFNGNGYTISNIVIDEPLSFAVGLFGCAVGTEEKPGAIYNLTVENVAANGYYIVGGVVGLQHENFIVENVVLMGTNKIQGLQGIGGIVGTSFSTVKNCVAIAEVVAIGDDGACVGIVVGDTDGGSLINCNATGGSVTSLGNNSWGLGGVCGAPYGAPEITNCSAKNVTIIASGINSRLIGGLVGFTGTYGEDNPTAVTESTVTGIVIIVSDSSTCVGGLIGGSTTGSTQVTPSVFAIKNCATAGTINGGGEFIGSIVGYAFKSTVVNCTSTLTWNVGDLEQIGWAENEISTAFAGGIGLKYNPYQIATAEQLDQVRNYLGKHFILIGDINLSEYSNWVPIGAYEPTDLTTGNYKANPETGFTGSFNGAGYTISNLFIMRDNLSGEDMSGSGLFGCLAGDGSVQNLIIKNANISSSGTCTGALVGMAMSSNENAIKGITLSGNNNIRGAGSVAGIVGSAQDTNIIDCHASANVTMTSVGNGVGIMGGGIEGGVIYGCSATGTVTATETMTYGGVSMGSIGVGGLAGCAFDTPEVINCTVTNVNISVGGNANMIGGLLGYAGVANEGLFASDPEGFSIIKGCEVKNVSIIAGAGASRIGGIVGSGFSGSSYLIYYPASSAIHIVNCTASGTIVADEEAIVGSILGYAFRNCAVVSSNGDKMIGTTHQIGAADVAKILSLEDT